jgi:hypothetical protein
LDPELNGEDALNKSIVLVPDAASVCMDFENVRLLFEIGTSESLEVLVIISAMSWRSAQRSDLLPFLLEILNRLLEFPIDMLSDSRILNSFCRLCLRLRMTFNSCFQNDQYPCEAFVQRVLQVTNGTSVLATCCHNLLLFWATFENSATGEMIEIKHSVAKRFIECSLEAIEYDFETASEFFGLDDANSVGRVFQTLRPIVRNGLSTFTNQVLFDIYERITSSPAQLAVFCNCVMGVTLDIILKPNDDIDIVQQLLSLLIDIYKEQYLREHVVTSFIRFVRQFPRCQFLSETAFVAEPSANVEGKGKPINTPRSRREMSPIAKRFYSGMGDFRNLSEMLEFLCRTSWAILGEIKSLKLVEAALLGVVKLFESFPYFVFDLPCVQTMISRHSFPFLNAGKCRRCRMLLCRILWSILVRPNSSQVRNQFFSAYDAVFDRHEQVLCDFFCDFVSFFRFVSKSEEHSLLVKYLLPHHLPNLVRGLHSLPSESVHLSLKFWSEMIKNEPKRIQFKSNSPNGLLLFHRTTDLLEELSDVAANSSKYVFRIFYSALSADYFPSGVFSLFRDDSLKRLLDCYPKVVSLGHAESVPKTEMSLQKLNLLIISRFMEVIVDHNVVVTALIRGLESTDQAVVQCGIEGLRRLATFSGPLDHDLLVKATLRVWNAVFEGGSEAAVCLTRVLEKDQGLLEAAFEQMKDMALGTKSDRLDELYKQFSQKLAELFQAEAVDLVPDEIQSFVSRAKGYLKKSSGIFSG